MWQGLIVRLGLLGAGIYAIHAADVISGLNFRRDDALVFASLGCYVAAFSLMVMAAAFPVSLKQSALLSLLTVASCTVLMGWTVITLLPDSYQTDIIAYSHEAAERFLDGENPYEVTGAERIEAVSNEWGLTSFSGATRTADGEFISRLVNYPAGHFLVYVPSLLVGIDDLRWTTLVAAVGVLGLLWFGAPLILRPLIALPALVDATFTVFDPVVVSDHIWLVAVLATIIAMYEKRPLLAAVLFGISMALKQQPWFLAPFLLVWVWRTTGGPGRERWRSTVRFALVAGTLFLAINLPFILWSPVDWVKGVLFIATANLEVTGSGPGRLVANGMVDIDKNVFFAVSATSAVLLFMVYWAFFDRIKHAVWVFPAIILWLGYRSNAHYFSFWPPLLLLSLVLAWKHGEFTQTTQREEEPEYLVEV
jgi:hypothetical protein